jgi:hypothetical protein
MSPTFRGLLASYLLGWCALEAAAVDVVPLDVTGAVQPQVTMGDDGRIHLTFGQGQAIFYTASADGTTFSSPIQVGRLEKLALGMRRGPRITASKDTILITALSHADGNLHAWTSPDGRRWQEQPALNSVPLSAREGLQALAGDGRGKVAVTWLDLRTGKMSLWAKFSLDGGRAWSEDRLVYAAPDGPICQCCAPSVAFAPDGRIGILWRNLVQGARDLYATETTDGLHFSPARKLGQGTWMLNGCPMDGGALAYDPAGGWLPVWKRVRTVFASDDATQERKVADGAAQPVATFLGSTPLIFWESQGTLMLQRGSTPPQAFAPGGQYASVASRGPQAVVAFEGTAHGRKTILCELVR